MAYVYQGKDKPRFFGFLNFIFYKALLEPRKYWRLSESGDWGPSEFNKNITKLLI